MSSVMAEDVESAVEGGGWRGGGCPPVDSLVTVECETYLVFSAVVTLSFKFRSIDKQQIKSLFSSVVGVKKVRIICRSNFYLFSLICFPRK